VGSFGWSARGRIQLRRKSARADEAQRTSYPGLVDLDTLVLVLMGAGYGLQFLFLWLRWLNEDAPDELRESWGPVGRVGRWGLMTVLVVALVPMVTWPIAAAVAGVFPGAQIDRLQDALTGSHSTKVTTVCLTFASVLPTILGNPRGFARSKGTFP